MLIYMTKIPYFVLLQCFKLKFDVWRLLIKRLTKIKDFEVKFEILETLMFSMLEFYIIF